LIELSKDLEVKAVSLDTIKEIDTPYWTHDDKVLTVREIVNHAKLIQQTDFNHPIILAAEGRVMDGMHRVARALMKGKDTINAVQFETTPEPDYRNVRPEDLPY